MERSGARRGFLEKPRVEAPPRLQVIGFKVLSPPMEAAEAAPTTSRGSLEMVSSATASNYNELPISLSQLSKPASSPRSALQLLLHQSLPSTSPTSSNHSLPPPKSSPNQNSKTGLLQTLTSPPTAANQKRLSGGLLQPSTSPSPANQTWTSGTFKPQSPPSAYQSNSSSGCLKSLVQSELTTSDISANQNSHISFFSSLSQSQYADSSVTSGGSQMLNQHNAEPAKAVIKENYEAFFQIEKINDDGNGATSHEVKGPWINAEPDHSHATKSKKSRWLYNDDDDPSAAKSKKSSWLHNDNDDDDHPSAAERCKKSSWKGVQPATQHSPDNEKSRKSSRSEEKSKKSSVFIMFVASSPAAPDYHHQGHSIEHNASKTMDFLSSCHLCRRPLGQGQDVFMYSGDRAFCSMECRYQQLVIDERKERCPPPIIRSGASPVFHPTSISATATHHPIMINKPYFINTATAA